MIEENKFDDMTVGWLVNAIIMRGFLQLILENLSRRVVDEYHVDDALNWSVYLSKISYQSNLFGRCQPIFPFSTNISILFRPI